MSSIINKTYIMKNNYRSLLFFLFLIFSLLNIAPAFAQISALDVVKSTSEKVIAKIKDEPDEENVIHIVDQLISPNFDFPKMTRWVMGKNWRKASKEQQQRFSKAFQHLLVSTYSKALTKSDEVKIEYLPVHAAENSKKVTIKTEVDRLDGSPALPINYRLYKKNDRWLVYDVSIEGVSLVSTYRNTFDSEIKKSGLDALIETLESRQ